MSEPRHRKLAAMGIASLVSTGRPEVLERLPVEIFNLWIDVFCEIKEARVVNEDDDESRYCNRSFMFRVLVLIVSRRQLCRSISQQPPKTLGA